MMHDDDELSNVVDEQSFMGLDTPMDSTVDGTFTYNYDDASYAYSDALIGDNSVTPRIPILPSSGNSITNLSSVGSSFLRYYDESNDADDENTVKYSHAGRLSNSVVSPVEETNDSGKEDDDKTRSCIPSWITNASTSIKFVILLSTALLVGCLALISIASTVPASDIPNTSQSNAETLDYKTFWPTPSPRLGEIPTTVTIPSPTPRETEKPTREETSILTNEPTKNPSLAPVVVTKQPSKSPTLAPVVVTKQPSKSPTLAPVVVTKTPSKSPTLAPIVVTNEPTDVTVSSIPTISPNIVSFYVMSRYRSGNLGEQVGSLPSSNVDFLIHLGNWNAANPEICRPRAYRRTAAHFENSTVPVLFVPGRNEWNFCPDPDASQTLWRTSFVGSEHNYEHEFEVKRQSIREENFSFVHKNALIIGLNMVGGKDNDRAERLQDNIQWVTESLSEHWETIDSVIFFGNTGFWIINTPFFDGIKVLMEEYSSLRPDLTFLYIKEANDEVSLDENSLEFDNFKILNIEADQWPPLRVSVDTNHQTVVWEP